MKTVQKLLKLGADPLVFTVDYRYPGDLAESAGFNNVIKLIIFQQKKKFFHANMFIFVD